jgi:hypothetical protein
MTFTGIVFFVLAFICGLFSMETEWLANVAVFFFGWSVAFIMLGMVPKRG